MRTRRHKLQVSTFPFLAVLLCAMGALLLVLLVMDRRAHYAARARAEQAVRRAAEEAAAAAAAQRSAAEDRRHEASAARQREQEAVHSRLAGTEAELQKEIQSVREELASAAERLRAEQDSEAAVKQKIEAEHAQAGEEAQALVRVKAEEATAAAAAAAKSASARKELEEMTAGLARLEKNLANLKAARAKEEKTFSLVPYNGKRGENRKPVYVECAVGQVVFHPDRTELDEPLSAPTVQAEVERRVARQKERLPIAQAAAFTPYLMLLVRPDGISTYYRFRETLQGLKIDFGYEFVDKDWVLDFPADDQDTPAPAWTTAAKPPSADPAPPAPPGGAPSRLHGVPPATGPEGGLGASHPSDGSPGLPGMAATPPGVSVASAAGPGGPALTRPGGNGSDGPTVGLNSPPLIAPADMNTGPALKGPDASPQPAAPAGGPWTNSAGVGGSPGSAAPRDPRVIATGAPAAPAASLEPPSSGPGQTLAPGVSGPGAGNAAPGAALANAAKNGHASAWATQGSPAAADPSGPLTPTDKPSTPPVPGPNQATSPATAPTGTAKTSPTAPRAGTHNTGGDKTAAADNPEDEPFLRAPPTPLPPSKTHQPAPLRPARLSGDRDWILYVECKPEGVVIYPTQLLVPAAALNRPSGSNPLLQTVQHMIDRKQASVRPGEMPYRPEVRFLVRPEAERTYHLAYPTLDALAAPKTSQYLGPDDEVSAVVAGH